jgi:hypothetical protein
MFRRFSMAAIGRKYAVTDTPQKKQFTCIRGPGNNRPPEADETACRTIRSDGAEVATGEVETGTDEAFLESLLRGQPEDIKLPQWLTCTALVLAVTAALAVTIIDPLFGAAFAGAVAVLGSVIGILHWSGLLYR